MCRKYLAVFLMIVVLLSACGHDAPTTAPTTVPITLPSSAPVTTATTDSTTIPTTEPTTEPTTVPAVVHSGLYLEGVDVEDVIRYFNEVVLSAEISNGGNAALVQKWVQQINYWIGGDPTEWDRVVLEGFAETLNGIDGFPGMVQTEIEADSTMNIYFCDAQTLQDRMGSDFAGGDYEGAVTFWYNGDNEIFNAKICVRSDIFQIYRNSVILEEIYNGLGPVQDTVWREDSIIYQHGSEVQSLSEIDLLILKLLYHPDIHCGMNADECEAVIRSLYY